MVADLLPINATPQERGLSKATGRRIESIPVNIRDLWNPDKCPVVFLPWLAWALSVDLWKDEWSEEQKRAVIKASIAIHRKKGTPVAVENYLAALGYKARVQEWFEYDGDEYKFKVVTNHRREEYGSFYEAVLVAKNTRSHLDSITVQQETLGTVYVGGVVNHGRRITIYPHFELSGAAASVSVGGGIRFARKRKVFPADVGPQDVASANVYISGVMHVVRRRTVRSV